jgi:hypothetical protein
MNQAARHVKTEPQQPKDEQNNKDCPKHSSFTPELPVFDTAGAPAVVFRLGTLPNISCRSRVKRLFFAALVYNLPVGAVADVAAHTLSNHSKGAIATSTGNLGGRPNGYSFVKAVVAAATQ